MTLIHTLTLTQTLVKGEQGERDRDADRGLAFEHDRDTDGTIIERGIFTHLSINEISMNLLKKKIQIHIVNYPPQKIVLIKFRHLTREYFTP